MSFSDNCPRFHTYLKFIEKNKNKKRSIIWISKYDWEKIRCNFGEAIEIDIKETPLKKLTEKDDFLISIINNYCLYPIIEIFRYDEKDNPTPINRDKYIVYENYRNICGENNFQNIINSCSTSDNLNLEENINSYVLLIKLEPGEDHWLDKDDYQRYIKLIVNKFK